MREEPSKLSFSKISKIFAETVGLKRNTSSWSRIYHEHVKGKNVEEL